MPVLAGPASPRPPYFVVGDEFSQPVTAELPGNRCTTCHRPQCDDRFSMPLIDLRMPAPFDRYHYSEDFAEDRRALRGCAAGSARGDRAPGDRRSVARPPPFYRATVTDIMRPAVCAGSRGHFGGMVDRLERPATPRGSLPPGSIRLYAGIEEG